MIIIDELLKYDKKILDIINRLHGRKEIGTRQEDLVIIKSIVDTNNEEIKKELAELETLVKWRNERVEQDAKVLASNWNIGKTLTKEQQEKTLQRARAVIGNNNY